MWNGYVYTDSKYLWGLPTEMLLSYRLVGLLKWVRSTNESFTIVLQYIELFFLCSVTYRIFSSTPDFGWEISGSSPSPIRKDDLKQLPKLSITWSLQVLGTDSSPIYLFLFVDRFSALELSLGMWYGTGSLAVTLLGHVTLEISVSLLALPPMNLITYNHVYS